MNCCEKSRKMANNAVKSYRKLAPKSSIKGRPTLGFGASSSSTGVGLFAQTPHCLRKNGVSWATQKSRTARIQSGSQGRAGWPGLGLSPPPITQSIAVRSRPGTIGASKGSTDRNRLAASIRRSGFSSPSDFGCPTVAPAHTFRGRCRLRAASRRVAIAGLFVNTW
jgi:hypothetical protein